jgi:hypothetical protein
MLSAVVQFSHRFCAKATLSSSVLDRRVFSGLASWRSPAPATALERRGRHRVERRVRHHFVKCLSCGYPLKRLRFER